MGKIIDSLFFILALTSLISLIIVTVILLFKIIAPGSFDKSFSVPVVQLDPSGHCVAVIPNGDCGMLPDRYTAEYVSFDYIKNKQKEKY